MPLAPNFKRVVSAHWNRLQRDTKTFQQRQKKRSQPTIINRDNELAAMEKFIAAKGVTLCNPAETPNNHQPLEYTPTVVLAWKE